MRRKNEESRRIHCRISLAKNGLQIMGKLKFLLSQFLVWITKASIGEGITNEVCEDLKFVSREEWQARAPVRTFPMALPISHVIIIHTVFGACNNTPHCIRNVQFIQDYHQDDKGWWDISYNFLIGGDGHVYVGVGWSNVGEHTITYNSISIGLAFMGNFTNVTPTVQMTDAAMKLITCGINQGHLTPSVEIHGHRDATCTDSPGDRLYAIIKQWKHFIGGRLPLYYCNPKNIYNN